MFFSIIDFIVLLGPILFVLLQAPLHFLPNPFSPLRETLSAYVWCDYGLMGTIAFYIIGTSLILLAIRLWVIFKNEKYPLIGCLLLLIIGIDLVLVAILPTRPTGAPLTIPVIAHILIAGSIAGIFPLAVLLIYHAFKIRGWDFLYKYTLFVAIFSAILDLTAFWVFTLDLRLLGLLERIMMVNSLIWIEIVVIKLINIQNKPGNSALMP